jgi:hypothetical protein
VAAGALAGAPSALAASDDWSSCGGVQNVRTSKGERMNLDIVQSTIKLAPCKSIVNAATRATKASFPDRLKINRRTWRLANAGWYSYGRRHFAAMYRSGPYVLNVNAYPTGY